MEHKLAWIGRTLGAMALVGLAGCAAPAGVGPMTTPAVGAAPPLDRSLEQAMCVETVDGGKTTNPLWVSEVNNQAFLAALQDSLRNNGLLAQAPAVCRYGVEAHLLGLSQPYVGFDVEVTANVNYRVRRPGDVEPYLLETVTSVYTTRFSTDKILWASRLKEANEGAVRKNIRRFIDLAMRREP